MLNSIRLLRALAALLVVLYHTQTVLTERTGGNLLDVPTFGSAGVDIFFVISGFIMVYGSYDRFKTPGAAKGFIRNRIIRIVPNYYLFTTLTILLLLFVPRAYKTLEFSISQTIFSYLFIFSRNNVGDIGVVVGVGWTLVFEAFFYLMFVIALNFKRNRLVPIIGGVFVAGAIIGLVFEPTWAWTAVLTHTIVFEFLFGCVIGLAFRGGFRIRRRVAALYASTGIGLLLVGSSANLLDGPLDNRRVIVFGIPAALIVAGALYFEQTSPVLKIPRVLLLIGDSSYSLYLVHQYVIAGLGFTLIPILLRAGTPIAVVGVGVFVACIGAGFGCYFLFERPVTRLLKSSKVSISAPSGKSSGQIG